MECSGFDLESWAAGWTAQMKPLSYGSPSPSLSDCKVERFISNFSNALQILGFARSFEIFFEGNWKRTWLMIRSMEIYGSVCFQYIFDRWP